MEIAIKPEAILTLSNPLTTSLIRCLVTKNEVELLVLEKNLKLKNAIDGTKIKKLESTIGEVGVATIITYFLLRFSNSFNVGKNITDSQAGYIAIDIIEKYPYETLEDILLMLKQARQGIIGDGKDFKLDGQNILAKWFPEYLENKYIEVERQNKIIITENTNSDAVTLFYEKRRLQKIELEKNKKVKNEIDDMVKLFDRQMLEDTIFDWEKKNDEELNKFIPYLRSKRKEVKGLFRPN